ncbi:type VI secretion protein IcmF/TssM N-terminal domain-containing protein [Variovorax saccharolyticus]|uniref:type VI secretion protein IcmF/TssM N-terminal domain-containing protein n=1 Tax=Variovorax saccharolyticus TaxID=3053516 RepID=UPI002577BC68|nr:type VI secretion protein IcmF/TssM N-terminal domain-containing protein [Variovorax sp. J31P216]MDM0029790.1 type VI secretion protein IcmF/TssM N-terminal domain-containing protein [Variovorax sp. J31P216]
MNERFLSGWHSVMATGSPVFPYLGLALLVLLGLLALAVVVYLLYRLSKRVPPMLRYLVWRIGVLVRYLVRRRGQTDSQDLMVAWEGGTGAVAVEDAFRDKRRWPWQGMASRPSQPLFVVMGPEGAGKSALLRAATTGLTAYAPARAEVERLPRWWTLDDALALELPTSLWADGAHARFTALLNSLRRLHRPRPLDGIVVVLQASQLFKLDAVHDKQLQRLGQAIRQLGTVSGLHLPLDIVVCGVEKLAGFEACAPILEAQASTGALHWRHPEPGQALDLDATLKVWAARMRETALTAIADAPLVDKFGERNHALRFPAQLASLAAPLGQCLARILGGASATEATPMLRGIWLTGLIEEKAKGAGRPVSSVRLAFLGSRLRGGVFSVAAAAAPTLASLARQRRRLLTSAGALAVSIVLLAWWMPATVAQLHKDSLVLSAAIEFDHASLDPLMRHASGGVDPIRGNRLLQATAQAAHTSTAAVLAPSSWSGSERARVLLVLGAGIQRSLIAPRVAQVSRETLAPVGLAPAIGVRADRAEQLPAYAALRDLLKRAEIKDSAMQTMDSLGDGLTYGDLAGLLDIDSSLPLRQGWSRAEMLPPEVLRSFEIAAAGAASHGRASAGPLVAPVWDRLLQEAYDRHPLVLQGDEVVVLLQKLASQQDFSLKDAGELHDRLKQLLREAGQPSARHLVARPAEAMEFFSVPLARLARSTAVALDDTSAASTALTQRRDSVRRRLLDWEMPGGERIFVSSTADSTLMPSPEIKRFASAYAGLMAQPFMYPGGNVEARPLPLTGVINWDVSQLNRARELAASARDYGAQGIQAFDPALRSSLQRLVQARLKGSLENVFWQAAQPMASGTSLQMGADPMAGLRIVIANTSAAVRLYRQALPAADLQAAPPGSVAEGLGASVTALLARLDLLLKAEDPYQPIVADIRQWMAAQPPVALAGTAHGQVRERLTLARDYVRAQYAGHAQQLLEVAQLLSPDSAREEAVQAWRRNLEVLDGFDKGVPGNSLQEMETFVLNLAKWTGPDDCARFLNDRSPVSWRSDYFSARLAALDKAVADGCARRRQEGSVRAYEEFADWFNAQAAGRPPFGASPEFAALSRRAFATVLERYADFRRQVPSVPRDWPAAVGSFVARMDSLQTRFGAGDRFAPTGADRTPADRPGAGKPAPEGVVADAAVRARFELRSERADAVLSDQIIDARVVVGGRSYGLRSAPDTFEWRVGEPIEVRLRWAAQSPYTPVAATHGAQAFEVVDRTAIFRLPGEWAFFDLLRRFAVRGDAYEQAILRFEVPVVGPQGRQMTQFYATVSALGKTPLGLDFPARAPALAASAVIAPRAP